MQNWAKKWEFTVLRKLFCYIKVFLRNSEFTKKRNENFDKNEWGDELTHGKEN